MGCSRREFLTSATTSAALLAAPAASTSASAALTGAQSADGLTTPEPPDTESLDVVIGEAYGELTLNEERQYWPWEVTAPSETVRLEYEVLTTEGRVTPDVLVFPDDGFNNYETKVNPRPMTDGPLHSTTTFNVPWVGSVEIPAGVHLDRVNIGGIKDHWEGLQHWRTRSPTVGRHASECLISSRSPPVKQSDVVDGGKYHVVFDWTDVVLRSHDPDQVTVDVAVRAVDPPQADIEETAKAEFTTIYEHVPREESRWVATGEALASAICEWAPEAVTEARLSSAFDAVEDTTWLLSGVKAVLAILEDHLAYDARFAYRLSNTTTQWTRWTLSVLPVVGSLKRVVNDACAVTTASPAAVPDRIEEFLLSIGILVADLLVVQFGVAGRVASAVTRFAHTYLLGFLARTLGLKAYLVLLRELYLVTRGGLYEAVKQLKQMTEDIGERHDFLSRTEVAQVKAMNPETVQSLDVKPDWLSLSPECNP